MRLPAAWRTVRLRASDALASRRACGSQNAVDRHSGWSERANTGLRSPDGPCPGDVRTPYLNRLRTRCVSEHRIDSCALRWQAGARRHLTTDGRRDCPERHRTRPSPRFLSYRAGSTSSTMPNAGRHAEDGFQPERNRPTPRAAEAAFFTIRGTHCRATGSVNSGNGASLACVSWIGNAKSVHIVAGHTSWPRTSCRPAAVWLRCKAACGHAHIL